MTEYPDVIVGTYEEFLLGYKISKDTDGKFKFTLDMASHAHRGSIRCLASSEELLASSGADEYINVYNIVSRKEIAVLTPHNGTVTALLFAPDGSHIISGSQDGAIVIFKCSNWSEQKIWDNAHQKANGVVALSIHPTGKLLLSIGADHTLRVWNLVKGRLTYAVNFSSRISPGQTLNCVTWSSDGDYYAIAIGQTVDVYSTSKTILIYSARFPCRVSSIDLSQKLILTIGRDDGAVEIHDLDVKKPILEQKAHEKRIKCLQFFKFGDSELYLVTADSQGIIKLWRWKRHRQIQKLTMETMVDADCRILCLTLTTAEKQKEIIEDINTLDTSSVSSSLEKKRKRKATKKSDTGLTASSAQKKKSKHFNIISTPKSESLKTKNSSTSQWNVSQ